MKSIVFVFCFLPFVLSAQFQAPSALSTGTTPVLNLDVPSNTGSKFQLKHSLKRALLPGVLSFTAGVNQGLRETLIWKRERFFNRFPNANRRYWDNTISWENKYIRPNIPVQLTDAYHFLFLTQNTLIAGAAVSATLPLVRDHHGKNTKWWHKLADIGIQSAVNSLAYLAGSKLTYNVYFK
ncbi:MAG: hypothetical protein KGS48_07710 [Bacteroidetes bacterium]|nr:hypothetical protein [Bacteroidota bacterium]